GSDGGAGHVLRRPDRRTARPLRFRLEPGHPRRGRGPGRAAAPRGADVQPGGGRRVLNHSVVSALQERLQPRWDRTLFIAGEAAPTILCEPRAIVRMAV